MRPVRVHDGTTPALVDVRLPDRGSFDTTLCPDPERSSLGVAVPGFWLWRWFCPPLTCGQRERLLRITVSSGHGIQGDARPLPRTGVEVAAASVPSRDFQRRFAGVLDVRPLFPPWRELSPSSEMRARRSGDARILCLRSPCRRSGGPSSLVGAPEGSRRSPGEPVVGAAVADNGYPFCGMR
jgi:hypothetical protein